MNQRQIELQSRYMDIIFTYGVCVNIVGVKIVDVKYVCPPVFLTGNWVNFCLSSLIDFILKNTFYHMAPESSHKQDGKSVENR